MYYNLTQHVLKFITRYTGCNLINQKGKINISLRMEKYNQNYMDSTYLNNLGFTYLCQKIKKKKYILKRVITFQINDFKRLLIF